LYAGYKLIEVDGGDLPGHRKPNVGVDIGYGNRIVDSTGITAINDVIS
jgi:hypothetical protein